MIALLLQILFAIFFVGLLTFLGYGKRIKSCKGKKEKEILQKKCLLIGIIMIAYVIFPFVINAIVTNKFYLGWWFVESSLSSSEWFAFFASYIGNIGTILFGWIAYWQTELINRQSEQAQAQQIQINDLKQIVVQYQV